MRVIRYRRHFLAMTLAVPLLWLPYSERLSFPRGSNFFWFNFAWIGALYAVSLVVALTFNSSFWKKVAFVTLAASWRAVSLRIAMPLLGVHDATGFILMLVSASAFGASGYWLLVRWFWFPALRWTDLSATVLFCVAATGLSWLGMITLKLLSPVDLSPWAPTLMWWAAFSASLYRSDRYQS